MVEAEDIEFWQFATCRKVGSASPASGTRNFCSVRRWFIQYQDYLQSICESKSIRMLPQVQAIAATAAMDFLGLLYSENSFTYAEHQLLRNAWAEMTALQRMEAIDQVLHSTITKLVAQSQLGQNGVALSRLVAQQISLAEAIDTQLTNHLAYIQQLLKKLGIEAPLLHKEIQTAIERVDDLLMKSFKAQALVYHNLQQGDQQPDTNDYYQPKAKPRRFRQVVCGRVESKPASD